MSEEYSDSNSHDSSLSESPSIEHVEITQYGPQNETIISNLDEMQDEDTDSFEPTLFISPLLTYIVEAEKLVKIAPSIDRYSAIPLTLDHISNNIRFISTQISSHSSHVSNDTFDEVLHNSTRALCKLIEINGLLPIFSEKYLLDFLSLFSLPPESLDKCLECRITALFEESEDSSESSIVDSIENEETLRINSEDNPAKEHERNNSKLVAKYEGIVPIISNPDENPTIFEILRIEITPELKGKDAYVVLADLDWKSPKIFDSSLHWRCPEATKMWKVSCSAENSHYFVALVAGSHSCSYRVVFLDPSKDNEYLPPLLSKVMFDPQLSKTGVLCTPSGSSNASLFEQSLVRYLLTKDKNFCKQFAGFDTSAHSILTILYNIDSLSLLSEKCHMADVQSCLEEQIPALEMFLLCDNQRILTKGAKSFREFLKSYVPCHIAQFAVGSGDERMIKIDTDGEIELTGKYKRDLADRESLADFKEADSSRDARDSAVPKSRLMVEILNASSQTNPLETFQYKQEEELQFLDQICESRFPSEESDNLDSYFVRTENAVQRIKLVKESIRCGVHLLLEGPTGTSKSETVKQAALDDGLCINPRIETDSILNASSQTNPLETFQYKQEEELQFLDQICESRFPSEESDNLDSYFVRTENAVQRIKLVKESIRCGVHLLLEGPTGTSKSETVKQAALDDGLCINPRIETDSVYSHGKKCSLLKFSCSSATTPADLLGNPKWVGELDRQFVFAYGLFLLAFSQGHWLLLDEMNLVSPAVLQCIEQAIDNGYLSVPILGRGEISFYQHPDFRLIATQNPSSGAYAEQRKESSSQFLSRFRVVNFPALSKKECMSIVQSGNLRIMTNPNQISVLAECHTILSDYRKYISCSPHISCTVTLRDMIAVRDTVEGIRYRNVFEEALSKLYLSRFSKRDLSTILKSKNREIQNLQKIVRKYYSESRHFDDKKLFVSVPFQLSRRGQPSFNLKFQKDGFPVFDKGKPCLKFPIDIYTLIMDAVRCASWGKNILRGQPSFNLKFQKDGFPVFDKGKPCLKFPIDIYTLIMDAVRCASWGKNILFVGEDSSCLEFISTCLLKTSIKHFACSKIGWRGRREEEEEEEEGEKGRRGRKALMRDAVVDDEEMDEEEQEAREEFKHQQHIFMQELYDEKSKYGSELDLIDILAQSPSSIRFSSDTGLSTILGSHVPQYDSHSNKPGLRWMNGPIVNAINVGGVAQLCNVDKGDQTINERLNPLLEHRKKNDTGLFSLPEANLKDSLIIPSTFRVIATAHNDESGIGISPAFENRFTVFYVPPVISGKKPSARNERLEVFCCSVISLRLQQCIFGLKRDYSSSLVNQTKISMCDVVCDDSTSLRQFEEEEEDGEYTKKNSKNKKKKLGATSIEVIRDIDEDSEDDSYEYEYSISSSEDKDKKDSKDDKDLKALAAIEETRKVEVIPLRLEEEKYLSKAVSSIVQTHMVKSPFHFLLNFILQCSDAVFYEKQKEGLNFKGKGEKDLKDITLGEDIINNVCNTSLCLFKDNTAFLFESKKDE
ncbi:hypothetical protein ADUPG1_012099, partial [Aduncisulcus paluster]